MRFLEVVSRSAAPQFVAFSGKDTKIMRNLISLAHVSLDGYMAGPGGDMSFISFDDELADHIYPQIASVDTAVYGRVTYQMMEGYWPGVLAASDAPPHARAHARWYAGVEKIVASRTLPAPADPRVRVVAGDVARELAAAKERPGGDMMIFASPTLVHALLPHDVIDTWLLTIQPVLVGSGLRLFGADVRPTPLALRSTKVMGSGVIAARYETRR